MVARGAATDAGVIEHGAAAGPAAAPFPSLGASKTHRLRLLSALHASPAPLPAACSLSRRHAGCRSSRPPLPLGPHLCSPGAVWRRRRQQRRWHTLLPGGGGGRRGGAVAAARQPPAGQGGERRCRCHRTYPPFHVCGLPGFAPFGWAPCLLPLTKVCQHLLPPPPPPYPHTPTRFSHRLAPRQFLAADSL
jgi:hypothetical protein